MKCKQTRTIFNLFEVYSCKGCEKYKEDEKYVIGESNVFIYYINSGCQEVVYNDLDIALSKKLKLFLKDSIINSLLKKDIIIVWEDDFNISKRMEDIYDLLVFDNDIYIIT